MRRLSSLGSKHLAHRKGRSLLTATGIVLGVAVLFGVLVANATTKTGVDTLVRDFTGEADVLARPAGAFDATMPASEAEHLEALPDVRVVAVSHRFESSIRPKGGGEPRTVTVRGVELATASAVQPYHVLRGRLFRPGAREVVIPERLRSALGYTVGDRLPVATPVGIRDATLVGILDDRGAARSDQGDVAFTSIQASRALADVGEVISGARLVLADGVAVESWIEEHRLDGMAFENAEELARGFQQFLDVIGAIFTFFAAMTLFVGAFLIYLTLSMAVFERTRVYGTMRALGATRRQIRRIVIAEALVLGIVSTTAGLAFGLLVAKGFIALFSNLFEFDIPGLTVTPGAVVAGILIGIVTTLLSSLVPARRASRLSPVVAMRGDYASETRLSRAWIAGLIALTAGIGAALAGGGAFGTPLILLGAVLVTPPLLRPVARVLGRMTNKLARGVGDVAVLHLVKERSRSAYTLALIMVVMALIFSVGGLNATLKRALDESLDRQFGADIMIHPFERHTFASLDASFERELEAVPGVGRHTGLWFGLAPIEEGDAAEREQTFARIIDPASYFEVLSFLFDEGNERDARRALTDGGAVLLPAVQAKQLGKRVGDTIAIRTARGVEQYRIAATFISLGGPPEIVFGLPDARRALNVTGGAGMYAVNVAPGAGVETVRARIERTIGERYNLKAETAFAIKQEAQREFGQFFTIFYAILLVGGVIGLLGLANTLAMSVLQRYREIGILRAIGTTRGQVRRMVLVESATLGLVAFVLAIPLGLVLSLLTVRSINDQFSFEVPYVYPTAWLPVVIGFGAIVAVLAAIAPGRRAARLQVVNALQYE